MLGNPKPLGRMDPKELLLARNQELCQKVDDLSATLRAVTRELQAAQAQTRSLTTAIAAEDQVRRQLLPQAMSMELQSTIRDIFSSIRSRRSNQERVDHVRSWLRSGSYRGQALSVPLQLLREDSDAGHSLLHAAVRSQAPSDIRIAFLKLLVLEGGMQVDIPDLAGRTPLHVAAGNGDISCVDELLELGADPAAEDVLNMTPLAYATKCSSSKAGAIDVRLRLQACAAASSPPDRKRSPHTPLLPPGSPLSKYLLDASPSRQPPSPGAVLPASPLPLPSAAAPSGGSAEGAHTAGEDLRSYAHVVAMFVDARSYREAPDFARCPARVLSARLPLLNCASGDTSTAAKDRFATLQALAPPLMRAAAVVGPMPGQSEEERTRNARATTKAWRRHISSAVLSQRCEAECDAQCNEACRCPQKSAVGHCDWSAMFSGIQATREAVPGLPLDDLFHPLQEDLACKAVRGGKLGATKNNNEAMRAITQTADAAGGVSGEPIVD